ncbi:MAG: hypothetical protein Kow0076_5530 [Francisella sp.]
MDYEQVIAILKLLPGNDVTPKIEKQLNESVSEVEKEYAEKAKKRRPPINFIEMGLNIGDILTYGSDNSITVEIVGDKKVSYNGEVMSLTAVTQKIKGLDYQVQPTRYWYQNGRNLKDIWEETYIEE